MKDMVQVKIRMTREQKSILEKDADENYMSVNEYLIYLINSTKYPNNKMDSRSLKFLDNNLPFLYRMMIKCMMKIERLAERKLSIDDIRETNIAEYDIIKQLGITKEEEGNFTKEERKW